MNITDYIKHFDTVFHTDISTSTANKKFPMLELAFNDLADRVYSLNSESRNISKRKAESYEKLVRTLNDEQRALTDAYFEEDWKYWENEEMQMLIFGFCIAFEQLKEMDALR